MNKPDKNLVRFGKHVRNLRLERGISSQIDLANKAGLDRTYVGGVERGERNVSLKNLIKLAKALKVDLTDLVDF